MNLDSESRKAFYFINFLLGILKLIIRMTKKGPMTR